MFIFFTRTHVYMHVRVLPQVPLSEKQELLDAYEATTGSTLGDDLQKKTQGHMALLLERVARVSIAEWPHLCADR